MVLALNLRQDEPLQGLDAETLCEMLKEDGLKERDAIKIFTKLSDWHSVVNCWFVMSDYLSTFEQWHEREDFAARKLAALVLARCHFMLIAYDRMLEWALLAQDMFALEAKRLAEPVGPLDELFVREVIKTGVDKYRTQVTSGVAHDKVLPQGLPHLVNRIAEDALERKQYEEAIIFAYDMRRPEVLCSAVRQGMDLGNEHLLSVALQLAESPTGTDPAYRRHVLGALLEISAQQKCPDHERICQALIQLDRAEEMAEKLCELSLAGESSQLTAMQMCFDIVDGASQQFIKRLTKQLELKHGGTESPSAEGAAADAMDTDAKPTAQTGGEQQKSAAAAAEKPAAATGAAAEKSAAAAGEVKSGTDEKGETGEETTGSSTSADNDTLAVLLRILAGDETIDHQMQFLIQNNHTDITIIKTIKELVRNSITQNAAVMANGLMHAGTTRDNFLRENLEWVSKARNWAKFNTVASLGVIHRGHEKQAMQVLQPYLPPAVQLDAQGNPVPAAGHAPDDGFKFKESGALMALGLVFAGHGSDEAIGFLRDQLRAPNSNSNLKHGACLGVGLAALGTADFELYCTLRDVLFADDALASEAAGLAMGLVMAGTMHDQVYKEMSEYMVETKHDKIRRGLKLAIAMLHYGRGDEALPSVQHLLGDKTEPDLRQTGVWACALAYVGTGEPKAIALLLKVIANDPDKSAKRFAATAIGFVTFNHPDDCLLYAAQMVNSFDGFIRYGAAMAVGIGTAGTGNKAAIDLIWPLLSAKEAYVRQGAVMSLSLIAVQHNEHTCAKVKQLRDKITDMVSEKTEESIAKFGAILAQGILDAGGRNVSISFSGRAGAASTGGADADMVSVLGALCFLEHWYWHSLSLCIALAFRPTCLIGLNRQLKMPKMQFECDAKASTFAYPPHLETKRAADHNKVHTAVLSVTAKAKKKQLTGVAAAKTKDAAGGSSDSTDKQTDTKDKPSPTAPAATGKVPAETAQSEAQPMDTSGTSAGVKQEPANVGNEPKPSDKESAAGGSASTTDATQADSETGKPKEESEPEPDKHLVDNPARVMHAQLKLMRMPAGARYEPLKPLSRGGVVLLRDTTTEQPEELVTLAKACVHPKLLHAAGGLDAGGSGAAPSTIRDNVTPPQPFNISLAFYRAA